MAELVELLFTTGLLDHRITHRFDCFRGTSAKAKLAADLELGGANVFARKPTL